MLLFSEISHGEFGIDRIDGCEFIFVIIDSIFFDGEHESLWEDIIGYGGISTFGSEGNLKGLHEGDIDQIFSFDLAHEIVDHFLVLFCHL